MSTGTTASAPAPADDSGMNAWSLPGLIGAELINALGNTQDVLQRSKRDKTISPTGLAQLAAAADNIRRLAIRSQQLSRLATGRLRQSHERVDLAQVLQKVLDDNDWRYYEAGVTLEPQLREVEVVVDPSLLVSLCETAIDCAVRYGQVLSVRVGLLHWPEHGVLTVRARPHSPDPARPLDNGDEVFEWVLLTRLAAEMGLEARRAIHADHVQLELQFPRTVRHLQGLSAVEVDGGDSVFGASSSRPFTGHHVLLVGGSDAQLRWQVEAICKEMRLLLDTVPNCAAAVRQFERARPDVVLLEEHLRDHHFDQLREDAARYGMAFPCVEITQQKNVVQLASWDGEQTSRVSRDALRDQLQSILTIELAKVF